MEFCLGCGSDLSRLRSGVVLAWRNLMKEALEENSGPSPPDCAASRARTIFDQGLDKIFQHQKDNVGFRNSHALRVSY